MAEIRTSRRYYLLAARDADAVGDYAIAMALRGTQRATVPATALPTLAAALLTKLASAGYTTVEDLDGADIEELTENGLTRAEADTTLKALES